MRAGTRKESVESRGSTAWNDGLYPLDGTGGIAGSLTAPQDLSTGTAGTGREGTDAFSETPWFAPVEDNGCKDGVCPVPWDTKKEFPVAQEDLVNHPSHYASGAIECIEAIEAQLTPEEYRGYLKGNCVKYQWRERQKGGLESLKKAQWYLNRLIALDESAQKG